MGKIIYNKAFDSELPIFAPAKEYGVQWTQSTDTVTRIGDADGLSRSDFDTIEPFASMRRCMVNDDRSINYYIDPTDPTKIGEVVNTGSYTTGGTAVYTGADGQVMVEIPKFFYKTAEPSTGVYQWFVSMDDLDGYDVHPAFVTGASTRDAIYMSAFEGNVASSVMRSISGVQPSTSTNVTGGDINDFRTFAQARGTGWQMQTYRGTQAIQVLYLIEYADFDTQTTIGRGYVDAASGSANESINTGATISLGNASGSATGGTDGLRAISYRGIENFWGNINKWVDGLNRNGDEVFVANDGFESDKFTSPYVLLTDQLDSGVNDFTKDITFPDFLMSERGGSTSSFLYDRFDTRNTGPRVAHFGGFWDGGSSAGGFSWSLRRDSSRGNRNRGSRLQIL